jgi:signal transduction histidine kinase
MARWRRQPLAVQDLGLAAVLGLAWFGCSAYWKSRGWYPANDGAYDLAGTMSVIALATRRAAPSALLAAGLLAYPLLYQQQLQSEFHLLPVLLIAYAAARRPPAWAVVTAVAAVAAGFLLASGVLHDGTIPRMVRPRVATVPGPRAFVGTTSAPLDWSRILFDEFAVAGMIVLGWVTATLAARNGELERLRLVEADRAVAVERTRIARELHDDVAHHLTALVVRAQAAERVAATRPDVAVSSVGWIAETARSALTSMRRTVTVLRDGDAPASLAPNPSLDDLPAIVARVVQAGLDVRVDVGEPLPVVEPQVQHAVVRVVQESLTNVLRHASARVAVVSLRPVEQGITVTVEDDGTGSDPAHVRAGAGHGLVGMHERAASCGGRFGIDRSTLGGWRVQAWFPGPVVASS